MNWSLFWKRRKAADAPQRVPNLFDEMRLGTQAQVLLDSQAYQRAVETMRVKLHEAWAATEVSDADGQRQLRVALSVLDGLESHVKTEAETGRLASAQIAQQEAQRKVA